jgi:hypothetical protein
VALLRFVIWPKLKRRGFGFYEIDQAPAYLGPDAGGTFSRRPGTNLGVNRTASKEKA